MLPPAPPSIHTLGLILNRFGEATYAAMAVALRGNASIQDLYMNGNEAVDQTRFDAAFVEALRVNPNRPAGSLWLLYSTLDDFERLAADELGHPTLRMLLLPLAC